MKIAIIGNGIIANLSALHLAKVLPPEIEIMIIGPESRGGMPVVGESTIEITAQFLERLGLGSYLRDTHYPKYALTYYFKLDPTDPSDRRYSVQCNERDPEDLPPLPGWKGPMARPPSWQLNREVFDRDIRTFVAQSPRVERILGKVSAMALAEEGSEGHHRLTVETDAGAERTLEVDWVVDASGRKRVLAKRLGLVHKHKEKQRNCFWFRLADFQRDLLGNIDALGPMPPAEGEDYHYDRYYSTHHFMGRGNWIWLIPIRSSEHRDLISIGISSRPDVYPYDVRSVEDFLEHVAKEHPVVADLVRSGTVLDTNVYSNYRYVIRQAYSTARWAVIGDAAFAPDPLFSNGLAFSTIQIEQVGAMVTQDFQGSLSPDYVKQMEDIFWAPVNGSQNTIAEWYDTMHDPLLCAAYLNFIEVSYFYQMLPLVVNRCHVEPDRLKEWAPFRISGGRPLMLPQKLLSLREKVTSPTPECFVYHGKEKVNLKALRACDNVAEMREQFHAGAQLLRRYVDELSGAWTQQIEAETVRV